MPYQSPILLKNKILIEKMKFPVEISHVLADKEWRIMFYAKIAVFILQIAIAIITLLLL